jgi:2-dehydropantoate 2-reductase
MKVCIYGAGAIGGFIGTRLAAAGEATVAAVARGATLHALRQHGWRLRQGGQLLQAPADAVEDPLELGVMDLVVVAVKGPALAEVSRRMVPLLGPNTLVLPAMNGVPWWFAQSTPALAGQLLRSVDPDGSIAAHIPLSHVVGCVVHASTFTPEPGLVEQRMGQGLIVGEPAGGVTPRVQALANLLARAGFDATPSANIRQDIWYKLWGNMTMNPVSALTGASVDRIMADPLVLAFCTAAMQEAAAIGARIGCEVRQSPEDRHAVTRKLGRFKTSMQNDVEAGRAIELDALVTVVREIALRLDLATPNIDALLGLTRLFARVRGLYPEDPAGEAAASAAARRDG